MFSEQTQDKLIDIGSIILKRDSLDIKTKALIGLSAAIATYCVHCHGQSKSIAKKFGASEEEIKQTEDIAMRMRQGYNDKFRLLNFTENTKDIQNIQI